MYKNTVNKKEANKVALIKRALEKFRPCFEIDTELSLKQFLDSLTGEDIQWGLINKPNLSSYLSSEDWTKLTGDDWSFLLRHQPQLADKCDWTKLDGGDWRYLLSYQPQFADKCDFRKLNGANWRRLLSHQPQLEKYRVA